MLKNCLNTVSKSKLKELPKIIDLFSGCGGLSLGFTKEGFDIIGGVEMSKSAIENISYNLHWRYEKESTHIYGDIKEIDINLFKDKLEQKNTIVIGGPPCQAYSMAGRSKLRSLGEDRIHTNDSRGCLYKELLRYVYELNSIGVVMENVIESVNYGGVNIPQLVCEELEKKGYMAYWTVLNAADYGVPQTRRRVFMMAIKEEYFVGELSLPIPTHKSHGENFCDWNKKFSRFSNYKNFKIPISPKNVKNKWVNVYDALSDLPSLFKTSKDNYKLHKSSIKMEYSQPISNDFQNIMRNWFGSETTYTSGHSFRKNTRDFKIFEQMSEGDDYRKACIIADRILEEECKNRNIDPNRNMEDFFELKKEIVPPYNRDIFHTRWKRLDSMKPSHTLVAHLGTDTYSHIHPWEPRGISVREAARLQSFPDGFLFQSSMGESFKQIGNAVPPLLANAVAKAMLKNIILI